MESPDRNVTMFDRRLQNSRGFSASDDLNWDLLMGLRQYLLIQSEGHHTFDGLEERSRNRQTSAKGRDRISGNPRGIGTV